jgi:beta-glucosidase
MDAAGRPETAVEDGEGHDVDARAAELCSLLSVEEKLGILSGDTDFWPGLISMIGEGYNLTPYVAGSVPRLGIEGIRFTDGPRGVTVGCSTCFPVAMARGATFDPELEERVGEAIGREARAQGANLFAGVCVNLLRHPAWGRAQETYGEDPEHVGEMGAALVRGVQRHVMACVKHFALNSMENARFQVDVRANDEVLDEVYLPHFERIVRGGVASVMSAYNSVNGEWCGQNRELLTTILRERWGFRGFVMSDFLFGFRDSAAAINAGLDLEMPFRMLHDQHLGPALESGEVSMATVDTAVTRILREQLRFASVGADGSYGPEVVACEEHRLLAREVATRSIVLLRNEAVDGVPALPFDPTRMTRLAVIGRLAAIENTGDRGSSAVRPPYVVTPLEGLRAALGPLGVEVVHDDGSDPAAACGVAADADAVVVVVGYTHEDEGENVGLATSPELAALFPPMPPELGAALGDALAGAARPDGAGMGAGGDRKSLTLRVEDEVLITALALAHPRVVVALMCSSAVLMERWHHLVPGLLILWYPGMEGGHAFADILLGARAPTGRLPFAIPMSEEHLPPFDPDATSIEYGALHGQRLLDHLGVEAAYPFRFGLTYEAATD